jgi:hypothetical protein
MLRALAMGSEPPKNLMLISVKFDLNNTKSFSYKHSTIENINESKNPTHFSQLTLWQDIVNNIVRALHERAMHYLSSSHSLFASFAVEKANRAVSLQWAGFANGRNRPLSEFARSEFLAPASHCDGPRGPSARAFSGRGSEAGPGEGAHRSGAASVTRVPPPPSQVPHHADQCQLRLERR